jgi:hypothetical protein
MSQMLPRIIEVVAAAEVHTIHGTRGARGRSTATSTPDVIGFMVLSLLNP